MKYEITTSEDGSYLRVRALEPITGDMAREFAGEAIKQGKKHGINRYLVDVRGTRNVSTVLEQYRLGNEDMEQFELNRLSKIAVVVDKGDTSHDFIETVFRNAGYGCNLYTDEESALNWLGQ